MIKDYRQDNLLSHRFLLLSRYMVRQDLNLRCLAFGQEVGAMWNIKVNTHT